MVIRLAIEFRLLGPVQVKVAGEVVVLGGGQRTTLLTLLLLRPNRVVEVDRLASVLWGGRPPKTARSALQVRFSQLRKLLGEAGDRLVFRPPGYLVRVEPDELDVQRFDRLSDQGRHRLGAGDALGAADLLREALGLWHGDPFADVEAPELADHRIRLVRRRLAANADRLDADLRLGRHAALIDELATLVTEHPLDERLRGQLMLALHRAGRRSEALAHYRDIRHRLVDRLGLEPGEELRRLEKVILTGTTAATTVVVPAQLPAGQPHFVGRRDDLRRLDGLLRDNTVPVIVSAIAGSAGIGKTTLALSWAQRAGARFPDGQLYVNLRGFEPDVPPMAPAEALRVLLDGLGVPPDRVPYGVDARSSLYRSLLLRRRMLILLDNAHDAAQVRPLLPGAPRSLVLVTSRDQMAGLVATDGARLLALDVFTGDEARELLAGRIGVDRAAAEPGALDEIVRRCAGLPLALAIVAARAATRPGQSLAGLVAELRGDELNALTAGDVALRAAFAASYRNLSDGAGRLVRLIGCHPGPDITVAAAASLTACHPDDTRRWLSELVRASLLTESAPDRFTMHDLLRIHAREQLPGPDAEAALVQLTDHYLQSACTAAHTLVPDGDPFAPGEPRPGVRPERVTTAEQALNWFATEQASLLAVFDAAATAGLDRHVAEMAWALARFFDRTSRYPDLAATQERALIAADRLGDRVRQARAHRLIGLAASRQAQYDRARVHLDRARALSQDLGDHAAQGHTGMTLAQLHARTGSVRTALDHAKRAYAAFRAAGHRYGQANSLNSIGWYHAKLGHYREALDWCTRAVALADELGDRRSAAGGWDSLGYAHHHLGDHERAASCYRRAVGLYAEAGDRYFEADTLVNLGDSLTGRAAVEAWEQALQIFEALDNPDADRVRDRLRRPAQ
ncbi:AfsR/SARP family transcriptional regulator [Paractinoplanes hotanensis]|uniref:Tetratricopeptide repeat protein n=1 Tax=Paractinoplanes hotanensis TaxID=2906497 RepID=A0ABT0Y4B7_9ACTN|nr:BTAD domain-containing putative transcriptional regulator [Actinoplanes hotanensis]MCM4080888.1 tetratricopeptide repeat protein [Actinoplanes hotanensis]